ncbi:MAG: prepilin-type N-terminal cleavage/methylation domain-containing protein [Candidatus Ozemobacteraceae bacterium]
MKNARRAFTLIEIMMVLILACLILGPAWAIFRSGSRTSLQGIQQIELVLEGRRVLRQMHNDLKNACFAIPDANYSFQFGDILAEYQPSPVSQDGTTYGFLSFPLHTDENTTVSANETAVAPRYASKILYRLTKSKLDPFLILTREEELPAALGGGSKPILRVLSRRVNYFSLKEVEQKSLIGKNQFFYQIKLQLAEAREPRRLNQILEGKLIENRSEGLIIGDFFDVVFPAFFSALWNQENMNRNWHSPIQGP